MRDRVALASLVQHFAVPADLVRLALLALLVLRSVVVLREGL